MTKNKKAELESKVKALREEISILNTAIDELNEKVQTQRERHQERTQNLLTLFDVATKLEGTTSLEEELNLIAEGVVEARLYQRALISLFDEDLNRINVGYAGLTEEEKKSFEEQEQVPRETWEKAFTEEYRISNSFYIPHNSEAAELLRGVESHYTDRHFEGWHPSDYLFIPLYDRKRNLIGVISVDDPFDGKKPTPESLQYLELFAREAGYVIERSKLYNNLAETEEYLETVIESSPDIIVSADENGNIKIFNKGAEDILGYNKEEMIGESVVDIYADESEAYEIMDRLQEEGSIKSYEVDVETKSGEEIPISLSASILYDQNGDVSGTVGISKDLRKLKKLQRELIETERKTVLKKLVVGLCHHINNYLMQIISLSDNLSVKIPNLLSDKELSEDTIGEIEDQLNEIECSTLKIAEVTERLKNPPEDIPETSYLKGLPMPQIEDVCITDINELSEEKVESIMSRLSSEITNLLVADDDPLIRGNISSYFSSRGFQTEQAKDGEEAFKLLEDKDFDVVVTDIKMPHHDGYEVFKKAKKEDETTSVVMITAFGYDPDHTVVKASEEGLTDVFLKEKPLKLDKLLEIVCSAIEEGEDN